MSQLLQSWASTWEILMECPAPGWGLAQPQLCSHYWSETAGERFLRLSPSLCHSAFPVKMEIFSCVYRSEVCLDT